MHTRVRDILATNYLEQLGIPPSATFREVRRALHAAELAAELGTEAHDAKVLHGAQVALGTEGRVLEYRVLAKWGGDERLAQWAEMHDDAVAALRRGLGGRPSDAAMAAARWLDAHADPELDAVLGVEGERPPLTWVAEVVEDYLSAFLVPGEPTITATELARLDLRRFPAVRKSLWMKLVECRVHEAAEVSKNLPEPEQAVGHMLEWRKLARLRDRGRDLAEEAETSQRNLRELSRDLEQRGLVSAEVIEAGPKLGDAVADALLHLGFVLIIAQAYTAALEVLARVDRLDCGPRMKETAARLQRDIAELPDRLHRRDNSRLLETRPADSGQKQSASRPTPVPSEARRTGANAERPPGGGSPSEVYPEMVPGGRPWLFTFFGTGFRLTMPHDAQGPLTVLVLAFTVLWIPLIPIKRYVAGILGDGAYRIYGRLPLRERDQRHAVFGILILLVLTGALMVSSSLSSQDTDDGERPAPTTSGGGSGGSKSRLSVGDCIIWYESTGRYTKTSCSSSGAVRVLGVYVIPYNSYPSVSLLDRYADTICPSATATYIYPTLEGWRAGDREIICLSR